MKTMKVHRITQVLLALLVIGVWGLLLGRWFAPRVHAATATAPNAGTAGDGKQALDELTVRRINIVDQDGKTRLVIANSDRFPDPVVRGKPVKRSIHTSAGLVFYDGAGNEAGGLATSKNARGNDMVALILDYGYQPTDGVGIVKTESADGKSYAAGLTVADRRPYAPGPIKSSEGISRIWLGNQNRNAALEITDSKGNTRIRVGVDDKDAPVIEMLDADGKVEKRL